jgi:CRISPR-associated protein Csm1
MEKEYKELIIGSFLHDIGKIAQRAGLTLSEQSKGMEPQASPTDKNTGFYGYRHVPYTNHFFEDIGDQWLPKSGGVYWADIANCATYHHKPQPDNLFELIIQQADCLSAGHDRGSDKPLTVNQDRLESIFANIRLHDNNTTKHRFRITKSMLAEESYPQLELDDDATDEIKALYQQMKGHLAKLEGSTGMDFDVYLEDLKWVYSQYAWAVPSSLRNASDVSLLDHSLTTAAISSVLYQYHKKTGTFTKGEIENSKTDEFRFVSGDVSGIQDYIFADSTARPSGVSKRLRAKSFYIGALTQIASMMILRELELPCFCKILDAGGRFTLLVDNTDQTLEKLKSLQKLIDEWMFKNFSGSLRINLAFNTVCSGEDFKADRFKAVFDSIRNDTEIAKKRQFGSIFNENGKWNTSAMISELEPGEIKNLNDKNLEFFEELGRVLPGQSHLIVTDKDASNPGKLKDTALSRPFDKYRIQIGEYGKQTGRSDDKVLARYQFVPGNDEFADIVDGQYIANYVPRIKPGDLANYKYLDMEELLEKENESSRAAGETKTFAHIAADSVGVNSEHQVAGVPMLGVLKADVDRLGMIFGRGLGEERKTIARMATLSRQIDMFFKGVLPNAVKSGDTNSQFQNIYTIYAGGDDLLLVGPWNVIMEFALYLRQKFTEYTCNNPDITISAGIVVTKAGFPLSEAARLAEEALEESKNGGRDRITVFGQTLKWNEYEDALKDGKTLDGHLEGSAYPLPGSLKITKSFAYRLIKYARMGLSIKTQAKVNLANAKWRSQLAYDTARNIKTDNNKDSPALSELERITGQTDNIAKLLVAATYCNYKNRRK